MFAGDKHDLAVAGLDARPTTQQQVDLLVAADEPGRRRSAQRLESARDDAWTQHPPNRHPPVDACHLDGAKVAILEESGAESEVEPTKSQNITVSQHPVARVLGDKPIEPGDYFGDGALIGGARGARQWRHPRPTVVRHQPRCARVHRGEQLAPMPD